MDTKIKKTLLGFVLGLLCFLPFSSQAEFTNKWDRVVVLPAPTSTVQTIVAKLTSKGYTCKIPIPKYQTCSLWTTNLVSGSVITLDSSVSRSSSAYEQVVDVVAAFAHTTDSDGNLRAQLFEGAWDASDPQTAYFYFQFSGTPASKVIFQYQLGTINEKVVGSDELPQEFIPSESVSPATFYGKQDGSTLSTGTYYLSANLKEGAHYYFGVGKEVETNCLLGVYSPAGEQINLETLNSYPAWHDVETNVNDRLDCLTNSATHMSVSIRYSSVSNYAYVVSNVYEIVEVATNGESQVVGLTTNLLSVTTNGVYCYTQDEASIKEVVTNFDFMVNSVQTNLVKVTNVVEKGVCRTAWQYIPSISGSYVFVFRGTGSETFSLYHAVLYQRLPEKHPNVRTLSLDEQVLSVPGWMNDPDSGFFDGVIDQSLFQLTTERDASYAISLGQTSYSVLVRAYDVAGNVLNECRVEEPTNSCWLSFSASSSTSYIGVCLLSEKDSSGVEKGFPVAYTNEIQQIGTTSVWEQVQVGYMKIESPELDDSGNVSSPTNAVLGSDGCWYAPSNAWQLVEHPIMGEVLCTIYGVPTNEVGMSVSLLSRYVDTQDPYDDESSGRSSDGTFTYAPTTLSVSGESVERNLFRDDPADWYSFDIKAGYAYRIDLQADSDDMDAVLELQTRSVLDLEESDTFVSFTAETNSVCLLKVCHGKETAVDSCYVLDVQRILQEPLDARLYPEDGTFVGSGTIAYDGFLLDGNAFVGTVHVETVTKKGTTTATASVQLSDVKYTYFKTVVLDDASVKMVSSKSGAPELDVTLGYSGLDGTCGNYVVKGARNGMGKSGDMRDALDNAYKTFWTLNCTMEGESVEKYVRLFLSVESDGVVKISGFLPNGTMFNGKTQLILGQDAAYVPILFTAKNGIPMRTLVCLTPSGDVRLVGESVLTSVGGDERIALEVGGQSDASLVMSFDPLADSLPMEGVEYQGWVKTGALSRSVTFSVKGLPKGLKLAAGTGVITGIPTQTGTFPITVVAQTKNSPKLRISQDFIIEVAALPTWASGTFNGTIYGVTNEICGTLTMSVSEKGKISGKVQHGGQTWSMAAASYSMLDTGTTNYVSELSADVICKFGKQVVTNSLVVTKDSTELSASVVRGRAEMDFQTDALMSVAYQDLWKVEPYKTIANTVNKGRLEVDAQLSLKFLKAGIVTVAGRFLIGQNSKGNDVVYASSSSAALLPMDDDFYSLPIYFPPNAKKNFTGFVRELVLHWDGTLFTVVP